MKLIGPVNGAFRRIRTAHAAASGAEQVGRRGRPVPDDTVELGCDWHTVNNAVVRLHIPTVVVTA